MMIGPEAKGAVPALCEVLQDPDALHRWLAAGVLGKIGPDAREAVPALLQATQDDDAKVRKAATEALNRIDPDAAAQAGVK